MVGGLGGGWRVVVVLLVDQRDGLTPGLHSVLPFCALLTSLAYFAPAPILPITFPTAVVCAVLSCAVPCRTVPCQWSERMARSWWASKKVSELELQTPLTVTPSVTIQVCCWWGSSRIGRLSRCW